MPHPRVRSLAAAFTLSTLAAVSGCSKKDEAGKSGGGSASAACAGANFNNDTPKICLKLPAGMTALPAEDVELGGKRILINGDAQIALYWKEVNFSDKDIDAMVADGIKGDNTVVCHGEVPGHKGLKFYYANFKTGTMGISETYLQGKKFFYKCKVNDQQNVMPAAVEACKTMWGE